MNFNMKKNIYSNLSGMFAKSQTLNSLKGLFIATALIVTPLSNEKASAQVDAASILLTGAAGAAGLALGNQWEGEWANAPYVAAAVVPALVNWGYNIFKSKNDEEKIKY
jgi:hypothetical protein